MSVPVEPPSQGINALRLHRQLAAIWGTGPGLQKLADMLRHGGVRSALRYQNDRMQFDAIAHGDHHIAYGVIVTARDRQSRGVLEYQRIERGAGKHEKPSSVRWRIHRRHPFRPGQSARCPPLPLRSCGRIGPSDIHSRGAKELAAEQ